MPQFEIDGFDGIRVEGHRPGRLDTVVCGTESFIHAIGVRLIAGPVDALLDGEHVRLDHFSVMNQGDRRRIVMSIRYHVLDHPGDVGLTHHRRFPSTE